MSSSSETLVKAVLALPEKERAEAAVRLIDSLEGTPEGLDTAAIDAAWVKESDRRFESYRRGETKSVPIEDVLKMLRTEP